MRLIQIKLAGFKSFVDLTTIDITGQLVGIVGPNGCGKSNVIDAVRWVLGESSAKQLRGENMQDVIFNGSLKRKASSRAMVELVFDNHDYKLNGLWNKYAEISIKRVLNRNGDNCYYINKQIVRRKDVTDLFLGTGVGARGYAVIEQGMISKIIEAKPEELRLYVEEAAGISKYRERRRETFLRIKDTNENLVRLNDILLAGKKNLDLLSKEAEVAKLYNQYASQKQQQAEQILRINIQNTQQEIKRITQKINAFEQECKVCNLELSKLEEELTLNHTQKLELDSKLSLQVEEFNLKRTALARLEERNNNTLSLVQRYNLEREELNANQGQLKENLELNQITTQDLKDKKNQLELRVEQLVLQEEEQNTKHYNLSQEYNKFNQNYQQVQNKVLINQQELKLKAQNLSHKKNKLQELKTRELKLVNELSGLDLNQAYLELKDQINDLELQSQTLAETELSLGQELASIEAQIIKLNLDKDAKTQQKLILEAQITHWRALIDSNSKDNLTEIISTQDLSTQLYKFLIVEEKYIKAVEAVLKDWLSAQIVASYDEIIALPDFNLSVIFKAKNQVAALEHSLASKVKLKDPELSAIYNILNQYQLIETHKLPVLPPSEVAVDLLGNLYGPNYIAFNPGVNYINLIEINHKLESNQNELEIINAFLATCNLNLEQLQKTKQDKLIFHKELNTKLKNLSSQKHVLELDYTRSYETQLLLTAHDERLRNEILQVKEEFNYLNELILELNIEIEEFNLELETDAENIQQLEVHKKKHEGDLELITRALTEFRSQLSYQALSLKETDLKLANLTQEREQINLNLIQNSTRLTRIEAEYFELKDSNLNTELETLNLALNNYSQIITQLQSQINIQSKKRQDLKSNSLTLNNKLKDLLEKINQAKLSLNEKEVILGVYREEANKCRLELEVDLILDLSLEGLIKSNVELEEKINALGLINHKALEDLSLAESQVRELSAQIEDLTISLSGLNQVILQIDEESRRLLKNTFNQLNQGISVYFKSMFGGGEARLNLLGEDILNTGIEISAEPPGKKTTTIYLLSGGEKTLTAMSFVFALFNLNPAPFCLLDEVDAPLDDANTARFCRLVKELSENTQFVYISHNRLAMEMADELLGVTMQEKGVSIVVSVSLSEIPTQEAS